MFTTSFMGLIAWDQASDAYNHSQLANNFAVIDTHDHTLGKGRQIPSGGIQDGAITSSKIAPGAITGDKIPDHTITRAKLGPDSVGAPEIIDGSVGTAELANAAVTADKVDSTVSFIGEVRMFHRVDPSVPIPTGWEVLDGRPWNAVANKLGPGGAQWNAGNMPDFRNAFPLGAALSGIGSGPTSAPDIGQVGGSHTINLAHSHGVNAHAHNVNPHAHTIAEDGDHIHKWYAEVYDSNHNPIGQTTTEGAQRTAGVSIASGDGTRQTFFIPGLNGHAYRGEVVAAPMVPGGKHGHGGATGNATATTTSDGATTNSQLSASTDIRPRFVGVLFIMRVR